MASPNIYPGGFNLTGTVFDGGPSEAELACYVSGSVQWLDTVNGANTNAGSIPALPVKTLAQAVTNSAANGLIVIGANGSESLGGAQTLNLAGLAIIGCGAGSSRPRYTNASGVTMFSITAAGTRIRNLYFPASTVNGGSRIATSGSGTSAEIRDCYFECGVHDTGTAVAPGTNSCRVVNCTFAVTGFDGTVLAPAGGIATTAALTDLIFEDCTFDGGSTGWYDYAFKVSTAAPTRMFVQNMTLLNRSNFGITITGTSYQIVGMTGDGTELISITA